MICNLSHRYVISITGDDRYSFLQGLITQDVSLLEEDKQPFIYGLLLSPQGRIEYDLFLYRDNTSIYIDTDRPKDLMNRLNIFKLRSKIEIFETQVKVYALWEDDLDQALLKNSLCFKDPRHTMIGYRFYCAENIQFLNDVYDYDLRRVQYALPDGMKDMPVGRALPLEWNMDKLNAISFEKGCYMGQELTARTKYRGLIKKNVIVAHKDDYAYKSAQADDKILSQYGDYALIWHRFSNEESQA